VAISTTIGNGERIERRNADGDRVRGEAAIGAPWRSDGGDGSAHEGDEEQVLRSRPLGPLADATEMRDVADPDRTDTADRPSTSASIAARPTYWPNASFLFVHVGDRLTQP